MSDRPQGPGWWLASDGRWYPPTATPGSPSPPGQRDKGGPWQRFRSWPLWAQVVTWTVVGLLAIGVVGAAFAPPEEEREGDRAGATRATDDDGGRTTTTRRPTTTASSTTTTERPTTTEPATTTTDSPTTTTMAPPTTTTTLPGFGEGTHIVGEDIQPGRYMATDVAFCYWERRSGVSGSFDEIIANGNPSGQAIVEVLPGDVAFNSTGCGRWTTYVAPAAPVTSFGDGDWAVGQQIAPGRYRATGATFCYWERASGFAHDFSEIIANGNPSGDPIIEIVASDVRFTSQGCGTWAPG